MNVLFLSRWFPYPPDNGSKLRVFNLIKHLASSHEVDLVTFASEAVAEERVAAMRQYCRLVAPVLYEAFEPNRLKALLGFFSRQPRSAVDTYSVEMARIIERLATERSFDVVIASEIDMVPYAMDVSGVPRVFEEAELATLYERFAGQDQPLKKMRSGLTWWKLSRYVADLLRAFDGCTVVSEEERDLILQVSPGYRPIAIVPNGVDLSRYAADFGAPTRDTLVYPGSLTYEPNFDAMEFFLRDVFPLIRADRPEVRILITGRTDGVPLDRLPRDDGIVLTGYLDDRT